MLENALTNTNDNSDLKEKTVQLRQTLAELQLKIRENKLPVIIIFEGWSASGKGSLIGDLIKHLDPRFFKVYSTLPADSAQMRYPMMKRFWANIPEYGKMAVMDRSWYQELAVACMEEDISDKEYARRVKTVNGFERQLRNDGYLIIKFFLQISKEEQKRRFDKLRESSETKWRVTERDKKRHKLYDEYYKAFDDMLTRTDTPQAHWTVIDTTDKTFAKYQMFSTVANRITSALDSPKVTFTSDKQYKLLPMPKLSDISLENKTLSDEAYAEQLKKCQKELSKLHSSLYQAKIPMIIAFEGWDAAGKGGAIKRISSALDPRGYEAIPIAAPDKTELAHHYLWRFWNNIPKTGHIAIFDRTWYGRVMVERIEGFCSEEDWHHAYREINEMEAHFVHSGALVLKFWLQIDKDEQERRFNDRMKNPEKRWKITDEDWRNREKWDAYVLAVNEMLEKTSTKDAPWIVVEGNSKWYARIKVLETVADAMEKKIKEVEKNRKR